MNRTPQLRWLEQISSLQCHVISHVIRHFSETVLDIVTARETEHVLPAITAVNRATCRVNAAVGLNRRAEADPETVMTLATQIMGAVTAVATRRIEFAIAHSQAITRGPANSSKIWALHKQRTQIFRALLLIYHPPLDTRR